MKNYFSVAAISQVKVRAELDPRRVQSATVASDAKRGVGAFDELPIQKPLFPVTSFTASQVNCSTFVSLYLLKYLWLFSIWPSSFFL